MHLLSGVPYVPHHKTEVFHLLSSANHLFWVVWSLCIVVGHKDITLNSGASAIIIICWLEELIIMTWQQQWQRKMAMDLKVNLAILRLMIFPSPPCWWGRSPVWWGVGADGGGCMQDIWDGRRAWEGKRGRCEKNTNWQKFNANFVSRWRRNKLMKIYHMNVFKTATIIVKLVIIRDFLTR